MVHCWACAWIVPWAPSTPTRDTKSGSMYLTEKQGEGRRREKKGGGGRGGGRDRGTKEREREREREVININHIWTGMFGRYFLSKVNMKKPSAMLR